MDKKLDETSTDGIDCPTSAPGPTSPAEPDHSDHLAGPETERSIGGDIVKFLVAGGIVAASVVAFMMLGEGEAPTRKAPPKPAGVAVSSAPIRIHDGTVTIKTNGVVIPFREISIAAEVGGRVVDQSENLRAGRRIAKGETLIRIDPTEYEIEVRRLQSLESQAQAELDALAVSVKNTTEMLALSKEELELQRAEMNRVENLRARNASSASETEAAKRAELAARAAKVRVENELREFEAQKTLLQQKLNLTRVELERARLDQSRTTIVSPVDGIISQSMVEEQAYVAPGQAFARIEDASAMEVRCNLTLNEMNWLWNHRQDSSPITATVRFDIGNRQHTWSAVFERIDGTGIDDNTRTVPCLFRVDRPDSDAVSLVNETPDDQDQADASQDSRLLIRGMFVAVHIEASPDRVLYRVPNRAIRPGKRVWVNHEGSLRVAEVGVVSRVDGDTVVESEQLSPKDQIITSPVPGAREGLAVTSGPAGPRGGKKGPGAPGAGKPGKARPGGKEPGGTNRMADNQRSGVPDDAKQGGIKRQQPGDGQAVNRQRQRETGS